MDDPRIEWIRDRVYQALDIADPDIFEELLNRDDGEAERSIAKFLNETPEENEQSIIFYKVVQEEEEEVEVECGKVSSLISSGVGAGGFGKISRFNFISGMNKTKAQTKKSKNLDLESRSTSHWM